MAEGYSSYFTPESLSSNQSWAQSFSKPSVSSSPFSGSSFSFDPVTAYNSDFTIPGISYDSAYSYGDSGGSSSPSTGGSNWMDWVKAAGLGMSAAGDAIRAYRGEPVSPNSPFQQHLAQAREEQEWSRMKDSLKEIFKSKTTDATEDVLDPAADAETKSYFSVPTLQFFKPSIGGMRMAGSVFSV